MKPGPPLTCECGQCHKCYMRIVRARYYERRHVEVILKNVAAKQARKERLSPEVSDEEMDRRALVMGFPSGDKSL